MGVEFVFVIKIKVAGSMEKDMDQGVVVHCLILQCFIKHCTILVQVHEHHFCEKNRNKMIEIPRVL